MKKIPTIAPAALPLTVSATLIVVAAALLREDGKILLQRRPEGRSMAGLWEFPGGKQEAGELTEAALVRELQEELAINVEISDLQPLCFASAQIGERPLLLLLYLCSKWSGEPIAVESPELGWFAVDEMAKLPMPPADIPLLDLLKKLI